MPSSRRSRKHHRLGVQAENQAERVVPEEDTGPHCWRGKSLRQRVRAAVERGEIAPEDAPSWARDRAPRNSVNAYESAAFA